MEDDLSIFMTDAWLEPKGVQNGAAFQGFPNFLLKAQQYGIPMEKVIHTMTGKTAQRFGIRERGTLQVGNYADITVFDPEGLKVFPEEPGRSAEGIRYVAVNGQLAMDDGQYLTQRGGQMILKDK